MKNKEFETYYSEYCQLAFLAGSGVCYNVRDNKATEFIEMFYRKKYNNIPFEIKMGLLKVIFDEVKLECSVDFTFGHLLIAINNFTLKDFVLDINDLNKAELAIINICPNEFLKTI